MLFHSLCLLVAGLASFASLAVSSPGSGSTTDFFNVTQNLSAGGTAKCITGLVPLSISSTNSRLSLNNPANQSVVTEIFQELIQNNSTIAGRTIQGPATIKAIYNIETTLCGPADEASSAKVQTVQVLTYGIGLDKSYWDIAPGYSYVDAAASAGYATIAYNRLGVGQSDHPDPIQAVQCPADVEILHGIVQLLRAGGLGSRKFKNVVGVGHSYGSIVQLAQTAKYPKDVDAVVLTSFTSNVASLPYTVLANNPSIAKFNNPIKFGGLPNSYLVHDTPISVQLPFFRYPYFDARIFDIVYGAKSTYTLGQQFTLPSIFTPAPNFTGPIDVVVGQYDFPFCFGACDLPSDQAAATKPNLYPAAASSSQSYILPNVGHFINAHYGAQKAFAQINGFLRSNGF